MARPQVDPAGRPRAALGADTLGYSYQNVANVPVGSEANVGATSLD